MFSLAATDLLDETRAAFQSFRDSHQNKRTPLPEELWQRALSLLDHFSISRVCRELRLSPQRLRQHRAASNSTAGPALSPAPLFWQVQPATQPLASKTAAEHSATVLPWRLVLERPDGTRLSLSLPASDSSQLPVLCSLLLRG